MRKAIEFLFAGKKALNVYTKFCLPVCQKYGVNQTGFDILLFLANHPQYNTARDLCMVRGIKTGIASVAVETLIRQGYLLREDDPTDRRIKRLVLSDRAKELAAEGQLVQHRFGRAITRGLSRQELEQYFSTTKKIMDTITELEQGGISDC